MAGEPVRVPERYRTREGIGLLGLGGVLVAGGTVWVGGPSGALVGGLAIAGWVFAGAPAGIALAHLGVLPFVPGVRTVPDAPVLLIEAGLGACLLAEFRPAGPRASLVGPIAFVGFGGLLVVAFEATDAIWLAGLGLGAAVATVVYGLHRYETVLREDVVGTDADAGTVEADREADTG